MWTERSQIQWILNSNHTALGLLAHNLKRNQERQLSESLCHMGSKTGAEFWSWEAIMDLLIHSTHVSLYAFSECDFNDLQMCFALLSFTTWWQGMGEVQPCVVVCLIHFFWTFEHVGEMRLQSQVEAGCDFALNCDKSWSFYRAIKACLESQRNNMAIFSQCLRNVM